MDTNIVKLSNNLVNYSVHVEKGEKVLIMYEGPDAKPLVKQVIKDVHAAGGYPYVACRDFDITRELMMSSSEEHWGFAKQYEQMLLDNVQCHIEIEAGDNVSELADLPEEMSELWSRVDGELLDYRVNNLKWVYLRYPNNAMAQLAGTSLESFSNFYYDVCTMDYARMDKAMDPLVELMNKTDKVHIVGPGTDLTFSIKGIGAVKCSGQKNIPDGEVYTAPVRESMNGIVTYNTPSTEKGFTYDNICFEVKDGKIIKATCNDDQRINAHLDTDEGSRYFGEFSFGINPYIVNPMGDILFDEKICGSFHLTPGNAYDDAPNGNHSNIHWDLIAIQTPEYGGGEIWFDDVLIRKDGLFVIPELEGLNPENLK